MTFFLREQCYANTKG